MNVLKFFLWLFLSLSFIDVVLGQEKNSSNPKESTTLDQDFDLFLSDLPSLSNNTISKFFDEDYSNRYKYQMINQIANKVWEDSSDPQYNRLVVKALNAYIYPSNLYPDPSVHFPIKKSLIDFFMALSRKYEEESLAKSMWWGSTL